MDKLSVSREQMELAPKGQKWTEVDPTLGTVNSMIEVFDDKNDSAAKDRLWQQIRERNGVTRDEYI